MKRLLVLMFATALLAAVCGLPTDDAPRQVAADKVPPGLLVPSSTQASDAGLTGSRVDVYFVDGASLRAVRRSVDTVNPQNVLAQLVKGTTDTDEANIRTTIPPNTAIVSASVDANVLTVVLSPEILSVTGAEQKTTFAQLVYTATELPGIGSVRFRVVDQSGAEQDVHPPTDDGSKAEPVTRSDYRLLAP